MYGNDSPGVAARIATNPLIHFLRLLSPRPLPFRLRLLRKTVFSWLCPCRCLRPLARKKKTQNKNKHKVICISAEMKRRSQANLKRS